MKMEQLTGAFHLDAPGARQRKRSVWWILAYGENCYEKSFLEPLTDEKKCYRAKRYMSCTLIFPGKKLPNVIMTSHLNSITVSNGTFFSLSVLCCCPLRKIRKAN